MSIESVEPTLLNLRDDSDPDFLLTNQLAEFLAVHEVHRRCSGDGSIAGGFRVSTESDEHRSLSSTTFALMDIRAIKSLQFVGRWNTKKFGSLASALGWPTYLDTCVDLSRRSLRTLRDVDRALWAAKGRENPQGLMQRWPVPAATGTTDGAATWPR